jgi:hypothetical protein
MERADTEDGGRVLELAIRPELAERPRYLRVVGVMGAVNLSTCIQKSVFVKAGVRTFQVDSATRFGRLERFVCSSCVHQGLRRVRWLE